jgi:hypothetical protein
MKILAFTDTHAYLPSINKILAKAKKEKPDLMICAGDFTWFGNGLEVIKRFNIGIPLLVIPGNHEIPEEISFLAKKFPFVKNIHLKHFVLGSDFFLGCGGGGFTEHHAEFEQSEEKFAKAIKQLKVQDHKYKVILVTHQPPYKTKTDLIYGEYAGSKSIRKFIEKYQPTLCITGHLHENFGKRDKIGQTLIINPGPDGEIIDV